MTDTRATLAALPRLAAQAAPRHAPARTTDGIRTKPGSKPPPGVDLDAIDVQHGRQHPHLLARLSSCVRVVWEEHPPSYALPPLPLAEDVTWGSECQWLLATADWWEGDDWCREWIATEVDAVRVKLADMIDRQVDRQACQVCGVRLEAYATDQLIVAVCDRCDAVAGMRPRLTPRQRADAQAAAARRILRAIVGG